MRPIARSLAGNRLKPAFDNLKVVSSEDRQTNTQELSEPPQEQTSVADVPDLFAQLTAERDQLQAEVADMQDRLLRRQAEFENFRRRSDRDRSDFLEYAGM